ncbi:SRPBCC family protein [Chitinophaga vietnamensis]|uniref:SRPBCC family protein n=1 Tax=Chitinophaga vietnamensis TaxID=2593957 RepID=UPI001177B73C|nr:SRPBCC domain-containing protein [Chitinophaga vietnamensis]
MNNNLAFDFSVNKENKSIHVKREFAAERSLVWDAYTKSEILDQWWGPKPWKARTKSMDFRDGGRWLYAMVGPQGEEHWSYAEFESVQPQKQFICRSGFADADGNINKDFPQSKWNLTFTEKDAVTLVDILITYEDVAHLETMIQMGFKEGFTMGLDQLAELLPSLKK